MPCWNILVVDDDPVLRLSLKKLLSEEGNRVYCAEGREESLKLSASIPFDLAVVDLRLKDGLGTDLLSSLKKIQPHIQSILITGQVSVHVTIISAIKEGIFYFIPKPFEPPALLNLVKKALRQKEVLAENKALRENIKKQFHFREIIGQSPLVLDLTEQLHKISKSEAHVLITGESGTGKELAARSIHCNFKADKPFISVNCGAVPADLLESEFFGHVKGSFTGAMSDRKGYFASAQNGSLFLDEIGSMSLHLQVKLLRVLQEKAFSPVGSSETFYTNARIISATNIDLEKAVERGEFRKDLYYRLNIIPLSIPPLRERKEDIPLLIRRFLQKFSQEKRQGEKQGKRQREAQVENQEEKRGSGSVQGISYEALQYLKNYPWPGNIRELENLIERLCVFKEGEIAPEDLPLKYRRGRAQPVASLQTVEIPNGGLDFNQTVDAYESSILKKALQKTNWNKRRAAGLLNLNRTTLIEKIKKKGLKSPYPSAEGFS